MSVSAAPDDVSLSGLEPNTNGDKIMGRDLRVMTTRLADIPHNEPCLSVIDTDEDHYNESDSGPDIPILHHQEIRHLEMMTLST